MPTTKDIRNQVLAELESVPSEFHPLLLQVIRAYRKSVTLKSATDSFAQGWSEARSGQVKPISQLWEGLHAR